MDDTFVYNRFDGTGDTDILVAAYGGVMVRYTVLPNDDAVREKVRSNDRVPLVEHRLGTIQTRVLEYTDVSRVVGETGVLATESRVEA